MFYEHAKASLAALIVLSLGLVAARAGSEGKPEAGQDEARKSAEGDYRRFQESPASPSCRLIDFTDADLRPGFVNNTYILIVSGEKPIVNLEVSLQPVVYFVRPDYWEIHVQGCVSGVALPATAPFTVSREVPVGHHGVEVVGAHSKRKLAAP